MTETWRFDDGRLVPEHQPLHQQHRRHVQPHGGRHRIGSDFMQPLYPFLTPEAVGFLKPAGQRRQQQARQQGEALNVA